MGPMNSVLCLLHSESMCMNSAVTIHTRWREKKKKKEKKKRKGKRETQNADAQ